MVPININLKPLYNELSRARRKGGCVTIQNVILRQDELDVVALLATMLNQTGKAYDPWGKYARIFAAYGLRTDWMEDGSTRIKLSSYRM